MTPHINASSDDFADTCLLPGDPLRAKFIADTFLTDAKCVTDVRNMLGFTGYYQGIKVSVMGTGMGIPSLSIYVKELITEYGVKNLIRVGSCGAVDEKLNLHDIVIATGASTDSVVNRTRFDGMDFAAVPDFHLTQKLLLAAQQLAVDVQMGTLFSADLFYTPKPERFQLMQRLGIKAVEMEAAGLFGVAAEYNASAAAICTVSDHITLGGEISAEDRERSLTKMMQVALGSLV